MLLSKELRRWRRLLRHRDVGRFGLRELDYLQEQRFTVGAAIGVARRAVVVLAEQGQQRFGDLPGQLSAALLGQLVAAREISLDQADLLRRDRAARQGKRLARAALLDPCRPSAVPADQSA